MRLQRGFTLIELLLSITAFGVTMFLLTAMLGNVISARIKNQTVIEVDQSANAAIQRIALAIRNATSVSGPTPGASAPVLTLTELDVSKNPTVFDVSGGVLRIKEGSQPAVPLTSVNVAVSNFVATNLSLSSSAGTIRITFTVSHTNPNGRPEYSYTKDYYATASLRTGF